MFFSPKCFWLYQSTRVYYSQSFVPYIYGNYIYIKFIKRHCVTKCTLILKSWFWKADICFTNIDTLWTYGTKALFSKIPSVEHVIITYLPVGQLSLQFEYWPSAESINVLMIIMMTTANCFISIAIQLKHTY